MKRTVLAVLAAAFLEVGANAATYYVDYANGSDANTGTATNAAWQHCPGDIHATGTAAATTPTAGDTVSLKGGVTYRGLIRFDFNGSAAQPINLVGNQWGTGNATISAMVPLGQTWTQCTNATDAGSNPGFANIWWTTCPTNVFWDTLMLSGTNQLFFGQDPNPSDYIGWQTLTNFIFATNGGAVYYTATSLVDADYLTNTPSLYVGGYVAAWSGGVNGVDNSQITNAAAGTVSFPPFPDAITGAQDYYFKLLNLPMVLDRQWETAILTNQNRIYLYSMNDPNGLNIEISRWAECLRFLSAKNIVVNGLICQGACVGQNAPLSDGSFNRGDGTGIDINGDVAGACTNISILNCEVVRCRGANGGGGGQEINVKFTNAGITISNCIVHECLNRGIAGNANGLNIFNNVIAHNSGSGMFFQGATIRIFGNTITNLMGVHSDGIATYSVTNAIVGSNFIIGCELPIAVNYETNCWYFNNVLDCGAFSGVFADWGGAAGTNWIVNNIMVGDPNNFSLKVVADYPSNSFYMVMNNIIGGGSAGVGMATNSLARNNVYVALMWAQDTNSGYTFGPGEFYNPDLTKFFVNRAAGNYRLPAGSPAIGAGTNLAAYFSTDITGVTRPASAAWDIGAYQYSSGGGGSVTRTARGNSARIGTLRAP